MILRPHACDLTGQADGSASLVDGGGPLVVGQFAIYIWYSVWNRTSGLIVYVYDYDLWHLKQTGSTYQKRVVWLDGG